MNLYTLTANTENPALVCHALTISIHLERDRYMTQAEAEARIPAAIRDLVETDGYDRGLLEGIRISAQPVTVTP